MPTIEPRDTDTRTTVSALAHLLGVASAGQEYVGSRSGSHVRRVVLRDGSPAILKVTVAVAGPERDAAERELAFYEQLAPGLTLRTPRVVRSHIDRAAVALVLTAHDRWLPANRWSAAHWSAAAADLADLHETPIPANGDWMRPADRLSEQDRLAAETYWRTAVVDDRLMPLLADPADLVADADGQPRCLAHGDCHTDNILVEGDSLIWTDWQQVGAHRPARELAFLSVRATPSGVVPPLADMTTRYAARRGLDPSELHRSVIAAELVTFLFAWPPFAAVISAVGVQRVHRQVRRLTDGWLGHDSC